MVKKISTLALAGLLALPAMATAGAGSTTDMQSQIDALTKQLEQLKAQMAGMKAAPAAAPSGDLAERLGALEERSEAWDFASRIQLGGDFRARGDYYNADIAGGGEVENDTVFTNRLRLDMRAKALENVEFKGRLAMYKTWGMQNLADGMGTFTMDGASTRQPQDNILRVDRAFVNWNNIADSPVWFSIGRRPTTDGPPNHLRMGNDERMATPTAYMDWPFDGVSVGYAYNNLFGVEDSPGRVRVCWGRGFENGLNDADSSHLNDVDFAGVSWDIYKKGNRFAYLQSFMAFNVFNYPTDATGMIDGFMGTMMPSMIDGFMGWPAGSAAASGMGTRQNIGDLLHTSAVYMDKFENLNYFASLGWSRTDPNDNGMFNDMFGMLNGVAAPNTSSENGYHAHIGVRYDIPDSAFKVGAEYNYGSEYWVSMTPGHDDLYQSKLATRGNVYEVYGIYDIPGGEAISKLGKAFIRLGYQHYDYNYTGSGDWNYMPYDIDSAQAIGLAGMMPSMAIEDADQIYMTLEAYF